MLNVQNEYANSTIAIKTPVEKVNSKGLTDTLNKAENSVANRDTFEYSISEDSITYSPESISKNQPPAGVTASSSPSYATTDALRKKIPIMLAAKMAGLKTSSDGTPIVSSQYDYQALQNARATISGNHAKLSYNSTYRYSQTGNSYGYTNARSSCLTYAFATALSIKNGRKITPDQIRTNSSTDGHSPNISEWGAYTVNTSGSETLNGIDAQLQLGNPVLIHAYGKDSSGNDSEHWATVIGKQNGEYTIIDPWDGQEHSLSDMQIYKNNGTIADYIILTNKY